MAEVFRLNHRGKYESLMRRYAGIAAIGHVRYATCGADDRSYAQPFERHHFKRHKWFSFAFNGQLANYRELRAEVLADPDNHLARDTDTEIIMHSISSGLAREPRRSAGRDLPRDGGAVRRGVQPGVPRRPGRHGGRAGPAGDQAAELRDRRPAVCRGQRERGLAEPRLRAGEHQVAACPARWSRSSKADSRCSGLPPAPGARTASSSGSTSPTWPARSTGAASTWPARPWARSWPGWRRCRSTKTRSWCRFPTPARPPPTPWPTSSAFPAWKV